MYSSAYARPASITDIGVSKSVPSRQTICSGARRRNTFHINNQIYFCYIQYLFVHLCNVRNLSKFFVVRP
jgi:hypothetical protein